MTALDADSRIEQWRIPVACLGPDPPRMLARLEPANGVGEGGGLDDVEGFVGVFGIDECDRTRAPRPDDHLHASILGSADDSVGGMPDHGDMTQGTGRPWSR